MKTSQSINNETTQEVATLKSTIGVYHTHQEALEAINQLQKEGYPIQQISVIGQAEVIDDHLHTRAKKLLNAKGVAIGAVLGPVLGVLTGVGIFAIPGLGFLFGVGAIAGAIAGFDFGLIGGGIISLFTTLGIKEEHSVKYQEHLDEGRFLVIAHGSDEEIDKARDILHIHGTHVELNRH